ncbi:MAG TPA: hypothetical protein VFP09_13925, partial [Desertimonas sp.]|nr:hypothetical protein [Desertimonas sp.]
TQCRSATSVSRFRGAGGLAVDGGETGGNAPIVVTETGDGNPAIVAVCKGDNSGPVVVDAVD